MPRSAPVRTPAQLVLTRFGLARGARPRRDVPRLPATAGIVDGAEVPGLLRSAFLVENPTTCYSLSLWSQPPFFSAEVPEHVEFAWIHAAVVVGGSAALLLAIA